MSEWRGIPEDISQYHGFVYLIYCIPEDKFYIGYKTFNKEVKRKPLKGKKRVRRDTVESKWRNYWGSSKWLQEDLEKYGEDAFIRQILWLCKSQWWLSYQELEEQIYARVMFRDDAYNGIVNVRLGNVSGKLDLPELVKSINWQEPIKNQLDF